MTDEPGSPPTAEALRSLGLGAGLHAVGFTHSEPFTEARVVLESRKAQGLHAGMQFTYRNPERSTTPQRILPEATTLIVGAWPYANRPDVASPSGISAGHTTAAADVTVSGHSAATQAADAQAICDAQIPTTRERSPEAAAGPAGEIAAYAWRDHYGELRAALEAMAEPLRAAGYATRIMADDNSLVDRAAAVRAGIGWAGKNSNVLLPGKGSWYVLGAIVTDAPYPADEPIADQCGTCRRCLDGCPTGAIVADGVVDARRCLAWLLQVEGDFPIEFRDALGTRMYGCDDCQTVCPPSRNEPTDRVGDEVTSLDLFELLSVDEDALLDAVGRWYIPKRDTRYVRRNALVALGNAELSGEQRETARSILDHFDPPGSAPHADEVDAMLAEHARWARSKQGLT